MFTVYILHSTKKDRFYIGYTGDLITERLRKHNSKHKGFTGNDADWKVVHTEQYPIKSEAMAREKQIKAWKSRAMIEKLIGAGHSDL